VWEAPMLRVGHTNREFERELRDLRDRLLGMAGKAERQIERAVEAVIQGNDRLATQVIEDDNDIDADEVDVDDRAFLILARWQPMASDLRLVMLAVKIVTDLERIGDLAVNIAKREKDLARFEPLPAAYSRIVLLADRVRGALKDALDAFVAADADKAERVISGDREIDALNMHTIADVISLGGESPRDIIRALALSSVSRYLERIGDHATNIAEMVIYFVRGRDVRHNVKPT
jgi:phosphate transport system protein